MINYNIIHAPMSVLAAVDGQLGKAATPDYVYVPLYWRGKGKGEEGKGIGIRELLDTSCHINNCMN